ncbi:Sialyltransferase-like protein 1, partial [Mucuna pruriens]
MENRLGQNLEQPNKTNKTTNQQGKGYQDCPIWRSVAPDMVIKRDMILAKNLQNLDVKKRVVGLHEEKEVSLQMSELNFCKDAAKLLSSFEDREKNMTTMLTKEYLDAGPGGWVDYAPLWIMQLRTKKCTNKTLCEENLIYYYLRSPHFIRSSFVPNMIHGNGSVCGYVLIHDIRFDMLIAKT